MKKSILLVEDTSSLAMVYKAVLKKTGYVVDTANSLADARQALEAKGYGIVVLDLMLPDGDGMDVISEILLKNANAKVVVITGNGSINRAIDAMRKGAFDFLVKPFDEKRLVDAVNNAEKTFVAGDNLLPRENATDQGFKKFIGTSPQMLAVYKMIQNIGRSSATVFITGESGTGKEVAAQAIHEMSSRANGPFVALNCGAIPADLLESEVFGHLKGSFTGAIANKKGAATMASGGTLFLDEICEMDLGLQTKLLRFLETSKIQPVGASAPIDVDCRILCATNRNPEIEVQKGNFREDLYYRLHVVPMHLPPLRERRQDIIKIADRKLLEYAKEESREFRGFSDSVKEHLFSVNWPGNVRQLLNVIRNIVVLNDGDIVTEDMLPHEVVAMIDQIKTNKNDANFGTDRSDNNPNNREMLPVGSTLAEMERKFVEATISHCKGSIPQAAIMLGVSPSTIYRKRESWQKT